MRLVFIAVAVCVAVTTAADLVDDPYNELENNIGIFLPKALNPAYMNRAVRSFYYNFWLYPDFAYKSQSPYNDYEYADSLTFRDVFEKPVYIVTPSQNVPNSFSMFYFHNGLRTLHRYQAFSWLQEFFKHPGLKGLIFYPQLIYNVRFFETPVTSLTFQEDLRVDEFVSMSDCNFGKIPYMFVASEDMFDRLHFDNIAKVSDFKVYKDTIEVHPVISYPRPAYESFYGTQSSYQGRPVPAPQPSGEMSESAVNTSEFRGNYEEPLPTVAQAERIVASSVGRGVYGGVYGNQYGTVQKQSIDGQYDLQGRMGPVEGQNQYVYVQKQVIDGKYNLPGQLGLIQGSGVVPPASSYQQEATVASQVGRFNVGQGYIPYSDGKDVQGSTTERKIIVQSTVTPYTIQQLVPTGNIQRTESMITQGQKVGTEGIAVQEAVPSGSVTRTESKTVEYVTESKGVQGGPVAQPSGDAPLSGGNVVRTEYVKVEGQPVVVEGESSVSSGLGAGDLVQNGGVQKITERYVFSSTPDGKQVRKEGFVQGGIAPVGLSKTGGVGFVTESHASGLPLLLSVAPIPSGSVVKTEYVKVEGQPILQRSVSSGVTAAGTGGFGVTERFTFPDSLSDQIGGIFNLGGNVGASIGVQGRDEGATGLRSEPEQPQEPATSDISISSTVTAKSAVASSAGAESSTLSAPTQSA